MVKVVVLGENGVKARPDLVGKWLDHSHYDILVNEDMDVYLPPDCADFTSKDSCENDMNCGSCSQGLSEKKIVFKFRKNFFSKEEALSAYEGLRDAAVETQNRGVAGGPRSGMCGGRDWVTDVQMDILDFFITKNTKSVFGDHNPKAEIDLIREKYKKIKADDNRGLVWLSDKVKQENFVFDEFADSLCDLSIEEAKAKASLIQDTFISKTTYANVVNSGIAGWYDRYPRIPYGRATSYTRDNREKFEKSYPFLQSLARGFKELLPWRYGNQLRAAESIDPRFVVPETPFTTITVNKNFRTAAHYDPANMEDGFANLCVISNNDKYDGCYLVFPEIGYAVNIRPTDLLLVNNQAGLHGNTEFVFEDPDAERISMIAFFHEGMLTLGSYDYEETRREFVESRRLNPDHPEQRSRWNGISPGLWDSQEWADYLLKHKKGEEWLKEHHRNLYDLNFGNSLENFF